MLLNQCVTLGWDYIQGRLLINVIPGAKDTCNDTHHKPNALSVGRLFNDVVCIYDTRKQHLHPFKTSRGNSKHEEFVLRIQLRTERLLMLISVFVWRPLQDDADGMHVMLCGKCDCVGFKCFQMHEPASCFLHSYASRFSPSNSLLSMCFWTLWIH